MDWEKIFANIAINKGLVSKIYISSYNSVTTKDPIKKWAEDLHRYFSKEDIQMVNRHVKRCSTLLIIRKMHMKTTMRHDLTWVISDILKRSTNKRCQSVEKRDSSYTVDGM